MISGSNQGGNNLTLKGWPLTGLDQLRSGIMQQQKSFMQGSQPFHQLQMMSPKHEQQLLLAQQENIVGASSVGDGSMSNSFRGNDQNKKAARVIFGTANSSGTTNTVRPSPCSAPSTPSIHTPGDVISMPAFPHDDNTSKPLMMFRA
ncbi:hypothetical protein Hanom_Chr16g01489271 [Helianthus anomalus]